MQRRLSAAGRKNLKVCCASAQARLLANTFCRNILADLPKIQPTGAGNYNWEHKTYCKPAFNGEIDVGLVEGEVQESGINEEAFYRDRLVVIAAAGHEAGGNMRWIIREEGSASREQWESFVRESNINIKRRPVIFNTNFAVKEAVKNNLGCALISEHIAVQAQRAGEVSIADNYPAARRDFYCLTLHSRAERRAVTVFKEDLHENFAKNEGNENKNED